MTPTSSLLADRNCLQVQADRSMSSAIAGAHDNSAPATLKTAKILILPSSAQKCAATGAESRRPQPNPAPRRRWQARFGPCKRAARQATFGGNAETGRASHDDHIGHRGRPPGAFGAGGGAVL